ncbi:MAG: ABC transporter ATP-binding protein, partial [Actinobacteria bacterium]
MGPRGPGADRGGAQHPDRPRPAHRDLLPAQGGGRARPEPHPHQGQPAAAVDHHPAGRRHRRAGPTGRRRHPRRRHHRGRRGDDHQGGVEGEGIPQDPGRPRSSRLLSGEGRDGVLRPRTCEDGAVQAASQPVPVETQALTKRYGETVAVSDVSLSVPAGSVFGLVGPNGAGKTTLLSLLAGLRRPSSGSIRLEGSRVGVLPDTPRFDGWLTGAEVVRLAAELVGADTGPEATAATLASAGLTDAADRPTKGYSRGMLQRLGLAAAVIGDPALLLLDEPAAALDPAGRREVLDLVDRLRGSATVIFSSHILDDVAEVCDTIAILRRGALVYQGSLEGLLAGKVGVGYEIALRSGHAE